MTMYEDNTDRQCLSMLNESICTAFKSHLVNNYLLLNKFTVTWKHYQINNPAKYGLNTYKSDYVCFL